MILWTWGHAAETTPAWKDAPLRSWRWALIVTPTMLGIEQQYCYDGGPWRDASGYYRVDIETDRTIWHVAFHHLYHDGPHHALWLGPLVVSWSRDRCDICMPPRGTDGALSSFIEAVLVAAMEAT